MKEEKVAAVVAAQRARDDAAAVFEQATKDLRATVAAATTGEGKATLAELAVATKLTVARLSQLKRGVNN